MTDLMRALRYPWRGKDWLRRMLPLTLLQFIPLVGQVVLVGYGQAVVRAIYRQQRGLPRLQLRQSFIDGLRLVFIGIIYCFPAILMVLLALSTSDTPEPETTGGVPGIVYPIIMLTYFRISGEIIKRRPAFKAILSFINRMVSTVFAVFLVLRLRDLFLMLRGGLQFSTIQLDESGMMTLLVASLLMAFISVALLVAGVRFTITGSGLLKPAKTLQLMVENRMLSLRFIVTVWVLAAGTLIAAIAGAVFMLVPGFLLMVAGNISIWFLAAQYASKIGIEHKSARA